MPNNRLALWQELINVCTVVTVSVGVNGSEAHIWELL